MSMKSGVIGGIVPCFCALLLLERHTNWSKTNQIHGALPVATTPCVEGGGESLLPMQGNMCCIIPVPFALSMSLFMMHSSWHRDRSCMFSTLSV